MVLSTLAAASAGGFGALFSGLGINAWAFLSQLVSFGIVFVLLWRWGFPAITNILDKRQAVIREGIENAERAKQELAEATARATKVAQDEARRIEEEARLRAEQIGQQYEARLQQEVSRARNELSRMVVSLSIEAAGKVIGRSIDNKDNRRLVEEFVKASSKAREQ